MPGNTFWERHSWRWKEHIPSLLRGRVMRVTRVLLMCNELACARTIEQRTCSLAFEHSYHSCFRSQFHYLITEYHHYDEHRYRRHRHRRPPAWPVVAAARFPYYALRR